jgi:chloride channel protein, CIC family
MTGQARGTLPWAGRAGGWARGSRGGLFVIAVLVGAGSGLGAVAFRYLVYFFTWLATGHVQFGQQGRVASARFGWLGLGFFVLIPVAGGLVYGPLIYRYAREARGHGVPEVMFAVAEQGGRIRPQVAGVKAVASALCIGVGGSVGREGPIVQIGSALASSLGQWVRMPENRMRILVACGAAGGIAATFNAPVTGVFFGVELILRAFSVEAIFTVMLSAMVADLAGRELAGSAPFLSGLPSGIALHHAGSYLLVAVLAVVAALAGLAFKNILYKTEDLCDRVWGNRPEWARPAVGGILLGLLLLAIPQMYGVGYPVLYKAVGGSYALWFLIVLAAAKMIACSLTTGIGGSGGVFAPSLFIGATSGMAFGEIAGHLFGPAAGQPALYAVIGMGAVFASAARGPLTAVASVVEMTGDYTLTLPVMLAVAIATALSRALSYGTIYTTKLLRRGTDIDKAPAADPLENLTAADAMRPFSPPGCSDQNLSYHAGSQPASHTAVPPAGLLRPRPSLQEPNHQPQVPFAGDQHPVQALAAGAGNPPLRDRVRRRRPDRCLDDPHTDRSEHRVERCGELGIPVADQELNAVRMPAEVHQNIRGLLGRPRTRGTGGDPGKVHAPGAVLDGEQHVQAAREHGVDAEEVCREDGDGLAGQERAPGLA